MNRTSLVGGVLVVVVAVAILASLVAFGQWSGAEESTDQTVATVTVQKGQSLPAAREAVDQTTAAATPNQNQVQQFARETSNQSTVNAVVHQEQAPPTDSGRRTPEVDQVDHVFAPDKYTFVFFYRTDDDRTQTMRTALETGVEEMSAKAEVLAVNVTDPSEKAIVDKFGVSRAPLPMILAVAPTGAITKSWLRNFDARQLELAFVSPCEAQCAKSIQDGKIVLLCIQNAETAHNDEAMKGVNDLKADRLYGPQVAVVSLDPADDAEAAFLRKMRLSSKTKDALTLLIAPPGRAIARIVGATNKADLVAMTKAAASACDPNSGCCPPK